MQHILASRNILVTWSLMLSCQRLPDLQFSRSPILSAGAAEPALPAAPALLLQCWCGATTLPLAGLRPHCLMAINHYTSVKGFFSIKKCRWVSCAQVLSSLHKLLTYTSNYYNRVSENQEQTSTPDCAAGNVFVRLFLQIVSREILFWFLLLFFL